MPDGIATVGLVLPAAFDRGPALLRDGRNAIGAPPAGRGTSSGVPPADRVADFDPAFFGISPRRPRSIRGSG